MIRLFVILLFIWNVITFLMMGIDKWKAIKDRWRISERALLTSAFVLGAFGSILGSLFFHHKTLKTKFKFGLPAALIANLISIVLIVDLLVIAIASPNVTSKDLSAANRNDNLYGEAILVLGCGIVNDETPSDMLADRLDTARALYNLGCAPKIIVSGDNGSENYNEIHVMLNYLINLGVPAEDIFCDHAGFSTYDSMHRLNSIFDVNKAIVVTQKYHQYRAIYIGKELGIDVIGVPSNPRRYFGQAYRECREILARCKDAFKVQIGAKPMYGGEKIDLSGDSFVSWEDKEIAQMEAGF